MTKKTEKGAELVEFALVLPFLLLCCAGVIEFGRAYYTYNILAKAVRDGARFASAAGITSAGVISTATTTNVQRIVVYGNIDGTGPTKLPGLTTGQVSLTPSTITLSEHYVTVGVAYPYTPLFQLVMPSTISLSPTVKMRFVGRVIYPT
ncbi:MAG TPA: TadE/TadG family type IV pilus assembly protein [Terriglobia bacterium]|nr:TadE/TadG family type IV pilus assembly protein [Terriglobia bacterium]